MLNIYLREVGDETLGVLQLDIRWWIRPSHLVAGTLDHQLIDRATLSTILELIFAKSDALDGSSCCG